jgi:DnaK suppressor protein
MTGVECENYRQRLLDLATRLREVDDGVAAEALRQTGGDATGNLSNVPMHLADLSTDAFEQEMSASLLKNERQIQGEVASALDRLEQGRFGKCERCSKDIGKGRLDALPYARYCVDCTQNAEDDGESGHQPTLL